MRNNLLYLILILMFLAILFMLLGKAWDFRQYMLLMIGMILAKKKLDPIVYVTAYNMQMA